MVLAKPLTSRNATITAISSRPKSTTNQARRCLGRAGVDVSMHEYYQRSVPPACGALTQSGPRRRTNLYTVNAVLKVEVRSRTHVPAVLAFRNTDARVFDLRARKGNELLTIVQAEVSLCAAVSVFGHYRRAGAMRAIPSNDGIE
jgi:hypothetical protein